MFTPNEPEKPKNSDNLDDLFSSPPNSGTANSPYTPPPAQPQQKRSNPILYIILGVVIAFMCLCVGCIAITGGSFLAIAQNPTVRAAVATGQVAFGTGIAMGEAPDVLPSDATAKGSLSVGQQQNGQLGSLDKDVWKYGGKKGEQLTVNINTTDRNAALIFGVYDSTGNRIAKNSLLSSGQQNQSITVTLPDDGTYSILVTSLGGTGNSSGNYTISVNSSAS